MKRSEMVEHTRNILKIILHARISTEQADEILQSMLNLGMAPPKITSMPDSYNRTEGGYGFEVHEWEEE